MFIKEISKIIKANSNIFDNCENLITRFWNDNLKGKTIHETVPLIKEFLFLVLIEYHSAELRDLINKNRQYKPKYDVIMKPYKPQEYNLLASKEEDTEFTGFNEYLFNTEYGKEEDEQPLGSKPEITVFKDLRKMSKKDGVIKVWGKNFTTSEINGAYLDGNNNLRYSFFDFVVKFENDTFLYIEVKSKADIDKDKTSMLKGAYAEYFTKAQHNLFDRPVVIGVWYVDTDKKETVHQISFYDSVRISKNLNELSVSELMDTISKL